MSLGNDGQTLETFENGAPALKVKSRTFNSSRQAQSNRNNFVQISNSQQKTPIAAQLSTAVTSGSQKNLNNTQNHPLLSITKKTNPSMTQKQNQQHMKSSINILRSAMDRSSLTNNLSHSILNTSSQIKGGITSINAGIASHGSIQGAGTNNSVIQKLRKTPSEFQIVTYLNRDSNLFPHSMQVLDSSQLGSQNTGQLKRRSNQKSEYNKTISPIKPIKKIHENSLTQNV